MSEVAIPQPVLNISSSAAMVSAADHLYNGQTSLSQSQSQMQMQMQSQTQSQPSSQSRKRPLDGAGDFDEGNDVADDNGIETQKKTDAEISAEVTVNNAGSGEASSVTGDGSKGRHQQPIFSTASTSTMGATAARLGSPKEDATPVKRRKVTLQEKEEKRLEKEEREREKAEMRARKDKEKKLREEEKRKKEEEKKLKEDERRKKVEEREEERKLKEEERRKREEEKEEKKREKEAERLMVEEERRKKERAQPKLHYFFVKPKDPAAGDSPGKESAGAKFHNDDCIDDNAHQDGNLGLRLTDANAGSHNGSPQRTSAEKSQATAHQSMQSDYERFFLPFTLQSYTTCAPYNHFLERETDAGRPDNCLFFSSAQLEPGRLVPQTDEANSMMEENIGGRVLIRGLVSGEDINLDQEINDVKYRDDIGLTDTNRIRGYSIPRVRDLMTQSQKDPIDLTDSENNTSLTKSSHQPTLINALRALPVKYLHFAEDVRPPYYGTFTRLQSLAAARSLSRNPLSKQLPDTNYEYDSEAEWEEPEEGEDIKSDEEEDDEEEDGDGEDDIATFLDDEEAEGVGMGGKRKMPLGSGDLEPVCSGLWWEDERGSLAAADAGTITHTDRRRSAEVDFSAFKMGYLIDRRTHSINPYSTEYWPSTVTAGATTAVAATTSTGLPSATTSLLNPATLLKRNPSTTVTQPSLLANGMSKKNIHDSNDRQRRQPLQSRPVCTIVNGGIAMNKDKDKDKNKNKNTETGPETDTDKSRISVLANGDRSIHANTNKLQTSSSSMVGGGGGVGVGGNNGNAKPQKRFVTADELPAFCAAIEGSCLTKIALVEELKRKFPKIPKDAISNSVGAVAERRGAKEVEKRWVLLGSM